MLNSDNEMWDKFKAMIGLQIGVFVTYVVVGGGIAVLSHQFILGVLPASEWSSIIGWVLAAGVGYFAGGVIVGLVVMILFAWASSR